jgi:sec-independent protein translocase protein TatC
MTLFDHLEEMRRRIIVAFLSLTVAMAVCYIFSWQILDILQEPAKRASLDLQLHYLSVLDPFMVRFKIALYAGIVLALPVIIFEILAFVAPALRKRERKAMYYALTSIIVFFIGGIIFCYYYILPAGLSWLVGQAGDQLQPMLTAMDYIGLVSLLLLALGITFETPLVVWLVVRLGLVTPQKLHKNWRVAVIAILIFAAFITPDWNPVTMVLVAVPMFILYEGSIVFASLGLKRRRKAQLAKEAEG